MDTLLDPELLTKTGAGGFVLFLLREVLRMKDERLKECQAEKAVLVAESKETVKAKNDQLAKERETLMAQLAAKEAENVALRGGSP